MFRKYIIPLIALAGVAFALFTVIRGDKTSPPVPPVSNASSSPYPHFVAGSGIVEANTENISIGTQIAGIVARIFVQIGSTVKAGDPLFMINDRALRAELATRRASIQVVEAQLAEANYDLNLAEGLVSKGISPVDDREKQRLVTQTVEAQLALARAQLSATETDLGRLTVSAPVAGQVLQVKVHPGEFAAVSAASTGEPALILLGNVTPLHVRVDVDENDAWRVSAGAVATGYLRGHKAIQTPLKFVRFEPYVVPKKSLTGDSTERVDTRVLQVIFSFDRGGLPIYVGQQMDVFIDAPAGGQPPQRL